MVFAQKRFTSICIVKNEFSARQKTGPLAAADFESGLGVGKSACVMCFVYTTYCVSNEGTVRALK